MRYSLLVFLHSVSLFPPTAARFHLAVGNSLSLPTDLWRFRILPVGLS